MTQERPHRPALSPDDAAAELNAGASGGRLDAEAVRAVLAAAGHCLPRRVSWPAGLTEREVEVYPRCAPPLLGGMLLFVHAVPSGRTTTKGNIVMVISLTTSRLTPEQAQQVDEFLQGFLPKLEQNQPGVVATYHFYRPDPGESTTIIIWESDEARQAYRQSDLIQEAVQFERKLGQTATREACPLTYATQDRRTPHAN